jgi:hypothetical protein
MPQIRKYESLEHRASLPRLEFPVQHPKRWHCRHPGLPALALDAARTPEKRSMIDFESHPQTMQLTKFRSCCVIIRFIT